MTLTLQQLTGAAERLRARRVKLGVDWLALVEQARQHANRDPFEALPLNAFCHKGGDKQRIIAEASPPERLIEETLRPLLEKAVKSVLTDAVHGYVRGRSTYTAALVLERALAAGRRFLLLTDIEDCFDSLDWALLDARLTEHVDDQHARTLLGALARAPLRLDGKLLERHRGIPLGRVISAYLLNLYMAPLDHAMRNQSFSYIRYADDLLIAAVTPEERARAAAALDRWLGNLRLKRNLAKTREVTYEGKPLPYLGHAVDAHGVFDRVAGTRLQRISSQADSALQPDPDTPEATTLPRHHTLYLTEHGLYVHAHAGMLVIQRGREVLREIPFHRIDRILALAGATLSSGFFAECISRRIPVLFFIGRGKAYGSLVASGMPNPWRLRAQYELLSDTERRLELARGIVLAKIEALRRRTSRTPNTRSQRETLKQAINGAAGAESLNELRGFEGVASRMGFEVFAMRIRQPDFAFSRRSRRPPRDPINSLLSFSYSLLFGEMQTALLAQGLDPHPSLLHESRPGHAALASDLIEPYRISIAEAFVLALVNHRRLSADDFHRPSGRGMFLKPEARRRVLQAFESHMEHGGPIKGGLTPRHALFGAAASMLWVVLGEAPALELPQPHASVRTA